MFFLTDVIIIWDRGILQYTSGNVLHLVLESLLWRTYREIKAEGVYAAYTCAYM